MKTFHVIWGNDPAHHQGIYDFTSEAALRHWWRSQSYPSIKEVVEV